MSYITDVVIYGAKQDAMANVNAWLRENDTQRQQQFEPLDTKVAGGTKAFCGSVYAAAFNYMPVHLIDLLKNPETWLNGCLSVIVLVDGENGTETFMFGYVKDEKGPVCRGVSTCGYDFG
jgi:hypothetical protein